MVHFSAATQVTKCYKSFPSHSNFKGKYECRGVNGFGTAAFSYHLHIEGSVKAREGPSVNVVIQHQNIYFSSSCPGNPEK